MGPIEAVPSSPSRPVFPAPQGCLSRPMRWGRAGSPWLVAGMPLPTGNTVGRVGQEPRPLRERCRRKAGIPHLRHCPGSGRVPPRPALGVSAASPSPRARARSSQPRRIACRPEAPPSTTEDEGRADPANTSPTTTLCQRLGPCGRGTALACPIRWSGCLKTFRP